MIRLTCATVIALFGILVVTPACAQKAPDPEKAVGVEAVLDDSNIPYVADARVLLLPSGERVLILTGSNGLAACCLLPPRPVEK